MTIEFECPECSREYRIKDELAGRKVTCKGCGSRISIPNGYEDDDEWGEYYDEEPEPAPPRPKRSGSASRKKSQKKGQAAPGSSGASMYEFDVSRLTVVGWMLVFVSLVTGIGWPWESWSQRAA